MPSRKEDPTGELRQRVKASFNITKRLAKAQGKVVKLFREIPTKIKHVQPAVNFQQTIYQLNAQQRQAFESNIELIVIEALEVEAENMPPDFWWSDLLEQPFRKGSLEETNNIDLILGSAILGFLLSPDTVLITEDFRTTLIEVQMANYGIMRRFARDTSKGITNNIMPLIEAGATKGEIIAAIKKETRKSARKGRLIASTEINKALSDAKLNIIKLANDKIDAKLLVLHRSALTPTTRDHHADRHGKIYTVEQQQRWWNTGANRINCKCSTTAVKLDRDPKKNKKVVKRQQTMDKQKAAFFKEQDK